MNFFTFDGVKSLKIINPVHLWKFGVERSDSLPFYLKSQGVHLVFHSKVGSVTKNNL